MISKEMWKYAWTNLNNRKVRSLLTILSIFVGISTIFIFVSFGWGLYDYVEEISSQMGVDKLVLQPKGIGGPGSDDTFKLLDKDLETFEKTKGITAAAGMMYKFAKIEEKRVIKYTYIISIPTNDAKAYALVREFFTAKVIKGRELKKGDSDKVALGYRFMQPKKVFDSPFSLNDKISVNGHELEIVGFYGEIGNPQDDSQIYMTEETFLRITGLNKSYSMIVGKVDNVDNIDEIKDRAEKNLRHVRNQEEGKEDFFVQTFQELIAIFKNSLNFIVGFVVLIALVSVLVSAINTANTMFTSILERTKEIGVLKSIGARNSQVLLLFLVESSILGLIAGIIGASVGVLITNTAANLLKTFGFGFLKPHSSLTLFFGCILFATLVGTISGVIPARNASKMNPVDSLRYE